LGHPARDLIAYTASSVNWAPRIVRSLRKKSFGGRATLALLAGRFKAEASPRNHDPGRRRFAVVHKQKLVHRDIKPVGDKLDFSLVNETGYGIKEVYVAPHSTDTWSQNLSSELLENGQTLNISFDKGLKATKWDIKIVWVDEGAPVVWMNCKLAEISKFILHYNRDTDVTSADTE
jgi:hypothetical protein